MNPLESTTTNILFTIVTRNELVHSFHILMDEETPGDHQGKSHVLIESYQKQH